MQNDVKCDTFKIEDFEPSHLKKAHAALEKHLIAVQEHAATNHIYKKGILKEPSLWAKFKHALHID